MSTENEESTGPIEYIIKIIEFKFPLPKICCCCWFFFLSLTITVHCLLDWIWTQLGNMSLGVSMRVLSKKFNWGMEPSVWAVQSQPQVNKKGKSHWLGWEVIFILFTLWLETWQATSVSCHHAFPTMIPSNWEPKLSCLKMYSSSILSQ